MDATEQVRAMAMLGQFNDGMTRVFDTAFGTEWAEIEDILVITAVATDPAMTTRRLADVTGLQRRTLSRMISHLRSDGLVTTQPSADDRRAVHISLTVLGERRTSVLRTAISDFFRDCAELAQHLCVTLGPVAPPPAPEVLTDPVDLLRRFCEAGVALVRFMPDVATHGQLAARQRAALVQITFQGGVRPSELSPSLGVSRAGVAYIIDQLCAKRLVTRVRGAVPEDRRAVVLSPTEDGVDAVHAVMSGIEQQREALAHLFAHIVRHPTLAAVTS
ncbi:winged helix DNA-binding protein [Agromyces atrinae]|uniref:MarR family winged helix-turn-helix transcriptional regulator n=1 Tax=Agromyces atrinae TaxID=592376 RepID=UPI001F57D0B3|nr:MarR family transcriptional regulator [Agromyces atrinae]MCI2956310.1 winged helix DNA-binding protein [Agromyces atrinae]